MFARCLAAALLLAGCSTTATAPPAQPATPAAFSAQCGGKEEWNDPALPLRIYGNSYYVGTCGLTAILITSARGHILIDGTTSQAAPAIAASIGRLGLDLRDIRYILNSHEHFDHAGGIAELKRLSGAQVLAIAPARAALESGQSRRDDPQFGVLEAFPPVAVDRLVGDGEEVRLGPLRLVAHATPAHAPGSTSWTWQSCEAGKCTAIAYADSISAISDDSYRFSDHPQRVAAFRAGLERMARLPCELLVTPHPGGSRLFERLAGKAPLTDANACRAYAATGLQNLETRLANERSRR